MATVTDSFNRANSSTTLGTADSGQTWDSTTGTWGITSNKAHPVGSAGSSQTALIESEFNDVDITMKITFGTGGSLPGLLFRSLDQPNKLGMFINASANRLEFWKTDNNTSTMITSGNVTIDPGIEYTVRAVAQGASITGYLNGTQYVSYTLTGDDLTQFTGVGYTKVGMRGSSETRWDDLTATATATTGTLAATLPSPTAALTGTADEPDPPGSVFDLTNFKITLPTEDPEDPGDADEVSQPELDEHVDANFYLDSSDQMVMIAPTVGETTGGSSATRTELREMEGGTEAAWSVATTGARQLTVSGIFDPTSITGGTGARQEMIVGQIHGSSGTPPVYLAVEFTSGTPGTPLGSPRLRVYKDGPGVSNPLTGLTSTTEITYRIRIESGRVKVWAAIGDVADLPGTPQFDWAAADFAEDVTACYLKCGSYNKTTVASGSSGAAIATITHLELIQPGTGATGALAASLPAPTAAITGGVTASGAVAGSLPTPTAELVGTVTDSGVLDGALPVPTFAATGIVTAGGALSGGLPVPTSSAEATVTSTGALATELGMPVADLAATVTGTGTLDATALAPAASLIGDVTADGELVATLPVPTASLGSDSAISGDLAGQLPVPTAELTADVTASGQVEATALAPVAAFAGTVRNDGSLAASLPFPVAALGASGGTVGVLDGVPPLPQAALVGSVRVTGELVAALHVPIAALLEEAQLVFGPALQAGPPVRLVAGQAGEPALLTILRAGVPTVEAGVPSP